MSDSPPSPPPDEPKPPRSGRAGLRQRVMRGSFWTLGGTLAAQGLRFASNLILTRLLFPEAFGLMLIVNVFLQGLQMFSDLGVRMSIIQNERGGEEHFLRTAWTLNIFRGLVLWLATAAIAYPVALLYDDIRLVYYLPVAGLSVLIMGFNSTRFAALSRELHVGAFTRIELASQACGIVFMVLYALVQPSVWALVFGGIVTAFAKLLLNHLTIPGPPMAFQLDRNAGRAIYSFGKWVFLGTILGFLLQHGDRLVIGTVITKNELGQFAIAVSLAQIARMFVAKLTQTVLFPAYSRLREQGIEHMRPRVNKVRWALAAGALPPLLILAITGDLIVDLLYPDNFQKAGPWLQLQAVVSMTWLLIASQGSELHSFGDSKMATILMGIRAVLQFVLMIAGGFFYGAEGLILAMGAANLLFYPLSAWATHRYRMWFPLVDAVTVLAAVGIGLAGLTMRGVFT